MHTCDAFGLGPLSTFLTKPLNGYGYYCLIRAIKTTIATQLGLLAWSPNSDGDFLKRSQPPGNLTFCGCKLVSLPITFNTA